VIGANDLEDAWIDDDRARLLDEDGKEISLDEPFDDEEDLDDDDPDLR
jgi:hypothetical protein